MTSKRRSPPEIRLCFSCKFLFDTSNVLSEHLNYLRGLSIGIVTNQWLVYIGKLPVRPTPTVQNVFHSMFLGEI